MTVEELLQETVSFEKLVAVVFWDVTQAGEKDVLNTNKNEINLEFYFVDVATSEIFVDKSIHFYWH